MATPLSKSNSFFKPSARSNHFALFFGSRTASPKWPTTPSSNGTFMSAVYRNEQGRAKLSRIPVGAKQEASEQVGGFRPGRYQVVQLDCPPAGTEPVGAVPGRRSPVRGEPLVKANQWSPRERRDMDEARRVSFSGASEWSQRKAVRHRSCEARSRRPRTGRVESINRTEAMSYLYVVHEAAYRTMFPAGTRPAGAVLGRRSPVG